MIDNIFLEILFDWVFKSKKIMIVDGIKWASVKQYGIGYVSADGEILPRIQIENMRVYNTIFINSIVADFDGIPYKDSYMDNGPLEGFIYFIETDYGTKIGLSIDPENRVSGILKVLPFKNVTSSHFKVYNMKVAEYCLHRIFLEKHVNGEWFDLSKYEIQKAKSYLIEKHNGNFSGSYLYRNRKIRLVSNV